MARSDAEIELQAGFAQCYQRSRAPVMLRIERSVCGCDYGGNSWATRAEADNIAQRLALVPGQRLMDLGAGAGWPGLYLATLSGCDITLVDLPWQGLAIAAARAKSDRLPGVCGVAAADGRALPYGDKSFDAITHSDVLCCLPAKLATLAECRRTVVDGGRMIFSVISVGGDLNDKDRARAIELGPPYVETEADYPEMMERTGWALIEHVDLCAPYLDTTKTFLKVDRENGTDLAQVLGEEDYSLRLDKDANLIDAITRGLLRRDLYDLRAA